MSEGIPLFFGMGRDGQPVERTRTEYPYSFDDYVSYTNVEQTLANDSAYTDRMRRWDDRKYEALLRKHFNSDVDYWNGRPAQKVEAFLRDYFDLPNLQLVRIWACCNQANGFEEWQFEWLDDTKALPEGYVAPKPKAKRARKAATTQPATGQAPVAV
jgi:hypothetical protein